MYPRGIRCTTCDARSFSRLALRPSPDVAPCRGSTTVRRRRRALWCSSQVRASNGQAGTIPKRLASSSTSTSLARLTSMSDSRMPTSVPRADAWSAPSMTTRPSSPLPCPRVGSRRRPSPTEGREGCRPGHTTPAACLLAMCTGSVISRKMALWREISYLTDLRGGCGSLCGEASLFCTPLVFRFPSSGTNLTQRQEDG